MQVVIAVWLSFSHLDACLTTVLGTTVFRFGDTFGGPDGMRIIKAGVLDDVEIINNTKPGAELFAGERIKWIPAAEGAQQLSGMPPA